MRLSVTAEHVTWRAAAADAWLHLSADNGDASTVIEVTADPNTDEGERESRILFAADDAKVDPVAVRVVQQGAEPGAEPIVLRTVEGYWAGDYWQTGGVLDDVYLVMTDREMRNGSPVGPGSLVSLDLNVPAATFETVDIAGTYAPSKELVPTRAHTFNTDEVTYVQTYDASGERVAWRYSTDGRVEISRAGSEYSIDLSLTLDDGELFRATYRGSVAFFDDTQKYLSTLDADCTPSLSGAKGTFQPYADADVPSTLLVLTLDGDRTQAAFDQVQLFLNVDPKTQTTGAIEREYHIIENLSDLTPADFTPGTAIPGYLTKEEADQLLFMGSWYRRYAASGGEVQLGGMAPFVRGTATVTREDKQYTIDYSFTDDHATEPHTISGTYRGGIEFTNLTDPFEVTAGGELSGWKPGGRW